MKTVLLKATILCGFMLGILLHPQALRAQDAEDLDLDHAKAGAEKGDANAEFCLGRFYFHGQGVPQDYAKAAAYFRQAAEQGNAKGENNLGMMYTQGRGVKKDEAEGIKWLEKSAEQGVALAQDNLAAILLKQGGAFHDPSKGLEWYFKAAEQGNVDAQLHLSDIYYFGSEGIQKDYAEAAKWTKMAVDQGNAKAENTYGVMNELGLGVPRDVKAAREWFRKSAEHGDPKGEGNYGRMFTTGLGGVKADPARAYQWLSIAAAKGDVNGRVVLDSYIGGMTADQIAQGKRLFEEYQAAHPANASPTPRTAAPTAPH